MIFYLAAINYEHKMFIKLTTGFYLAFLLQLGPFQTNLLFVAFLTDGQTQIETLGATSFGQHDNLSNTLKRTFYQS
jgi:hypothetical protein